MSDNPRVVLITGGTKGIGLAVAQAYARLGDIVAVSGRSDSLALRKAVDSLKLIQPRATGSLVDVRDSQSVVSWVNGIVEEFGQIDVAIANAGIIRPRSFLQLEESQWDEVVDTHLKGTFLVLQSVARTMIERHVVGSLITVTALSALRGGTGVTDYASAKGGIISLTRNLAMELGPYEIRVNAILPAAETDMTETLRLFRGLDQESWNKRYSPKRPLQPDDIVGPFIFLGSDAARHVTGQIIAVGPPQVIA
ncbi:MAG: SDR family NAD(P)-dependent oxidoreductase [Candidatus Bathyarchaeia archaeon]